MGSYRRAMMTGFLCRLCSLYKDVVIHLYSNKGRELSLLEKIKILPVSIKKYDKLPKTICKSCTEKLCSQYEYVQQIRRNLEIQGKHHALHANGCPRHCILRNVPNRGASTSATSSAQIISANVQSTTEQLAMDVDPANQTGDNNNVEGSSS